MDVHKKIIFLYEHIQIGKGISECYFSGGKVILTIIAH
jgi:hypothetical protein